MKEEKDWIDVMKWHNWFTHYAEQLKEFGITLKVFRKDYKEQTDYLIHYNDVTVDFHYITWDIAVCLVWSALRCLESIKKEEKDEKNEKKNIIKKDKTIFKEMG